MSDEPHTTVTDAQFLFANDFGSYVTIPGTVVCGLVLVAYGLIAVGSKAARTHLDRVSFRLLTYSLFFNVLFGIDYALTPTAPGKGCSLAAFFNNLTLCLSSFFTTCIAINLQLVLVHRINGKDLEKYYVLGTVLLTLVLNMPTVALDQFGWNEDTATCWYSNSDSRTRLSWIVGTSSVWIALAATVETVCSAIVLFWLYFHVKSIQTLSCTDYIGTSPTSTAVASDAASAQTSSHGSPNPQYSADNCGHKREAERQPLMFLDPRFRNIIVRIALYPIVSLIMNYTTVILDLYLAIFNVMDEKDFRLLVLDLTFYGLRGFAYGALAASDPSFIKAVKVILQSSKLLKSRNATLPATKQKTGLTSLHFAANPRGDLWADPDLVLIARLPFWYGAKSGDPITCQVTQPWPILAYAMFSEDFDQGATLSKSQVAFADKFAKSSTIPGTIVCGLVLLAYGAVSLRKRARKCLNRVSFRLLSYSLLFNVLFGLAFSLTPGRSGRACDIRAFLVNFTLCLATFFTTCIAINLQLVLVHEVDGKKAEKYYIVGATALALALNVPTYGFGQFGWNVETATCWYSNADQKRRLVWMVSTQSLWIALAAIIETFCSGITLYRLYRFQQATVILMNDHNIKPVEEKQLPRSAIPRTRPSLLSVMARDPAFRKVVLRIALYPIVSLLMNLSTVILDVRLGILGLNTELDFRVLVLDLTFYGLRTFAYGVLAALDPSFVNALMIVYKSLRHSGDSEDDYNLSTIQFASRDDQPDRTAPTSPRLTDIDGTLNRTTSQDSDKTLISTTSATLGSTRSFELASEERSRQRIGEQL